MRGPIARGIAFLLAGATGLAAHTDGALADTGPCHSMEYERAAYIVGTGQMGPLCASF
jgi:hypothetical protein